MQYFYEEGFYPLTWYDNDKPISSYRSGIELWPIKSLYNTKEQELLDINICKLFNITHSVTYLEKTDKFLEIFRFFSDNNQIYLFDFNVFCHFIFYFKESMQKFIFTCNHECFKVPVKREISVKMGDNENCFLQLVPVKKYYIKGKFDKVYLTQHEKNCVHWCAQGKSSEEIAMILGISKKTIESRIYKIKEKLDCYKQSQLITIAIEQGIVNCKQK